MENFFSHDDDDLPISIESLSHFLTDEQIHCQSYREWGLQGKNEKAFPSSQSSGVPFSSLWLLSSSTMKKKWKVKKNECFCFDVCCLLSIM